MASPPKETAAPRYLTPDEAAEFLRMSPRTLEKQRTLGGGPRFRKFGRMVRYTMRDLVTWAEARSFAMTSEPECRPPGRADHDDGA
jgi:hypothetical protein